MALREAVPGRAAAGPEEPMTSRASRTRSGPVFGSVPMPLKIPSGQGLPAAAGSKAFEMKVMLNIDG
jgi:hypothetical protein